MLFKAQKPTLSDHLHWIVRLGVVVWALLMRRKSRWRRFNGYRLLDQVHRALLRKPLATLKAA